MRINKQFVFDAANETYGTYQNISRIVDETNQVADELSAATAKTIATYKKKLSADTSTFMTVGDRREDLKITIDYIVNRGGTIEEGRTSLVNIDEYTVNSSVNATGDDGFELSGRFKDVDFLGDFSDAPKPRKWWHSILANNGKIYGIPYNDNRVLEIDPEDGSVNFLGDPSVIGIGTGEGQIGHRWKDSILANNGKIYGIPYNDNRVLEIDPEDGLVNFLGDPSVLIGETTGLYKWHKPVIANNGKIYSTLYGQQNYILEIDPINRTVNLVGDYIVRASWGWEDSFLGENGKIYQMPISESRIIEFNPVDGSVNFIGDSIISKKGVIKYRSFAKADNGKIYGIPLNDDRILEFNSADGSINFLGDSSVIAEVADEFRWWGHALSSDNKKIYAIPWNDNRILEINTEDGSVNFLGDPSVIGTSSNKWYYNPVLANNGKIYGIPSTDNRVLEINPEDGSVNFLGDPSVIGITVEKWKYCVLGANSKIYAVPYNDDRVLEINPEDGSVNLLGEFDINNNGYIEVTSANNEKLYSVPYKNESVLEIDPLKRELQLVAKDTSTNTADASIYYTLNKIKL